MRRLLIAVVGTFLLAAILTRLAEATGRKQCGCRDDCWCKNPGLSLFRWVVPRRLHRSWTADEKQAFAEAARSD